MNVRCVMSVFEIMFSPTGGTKKVSNVFTKAFAPESTVIDLLKKDQDFSACSFAKEDVCIVSVPSYGGRVPAPAVERLAQNGAAAILVVVYGNRDFDDTFAELQDTLAAAGFACAAGIAAIAEHSIMRQFAAGRPDSGDEEQLRRFAEEVRKKLQGQAEQKARSEMEHPAGAGSQVKADNPVKPDGFVLPGNRPYRKYGGVPMKPQAGKKCTRCGVCAAECPVGAIFTDDPSKTNAEICISCMRCIAVCPQNARSNSKALLAAGSLMLKKECSVRKENTLFFCK